MNECSNLDPARADPVDLGPPPHEELCWSDGKKDEAIAIVKRCMELEPTRLSWGKRLRNFEQGKID